MSKIRNVKSYNLKKCIFKDLDGFEEDVKAAVGKNTTVEYADLISGIEIKQNGKTLSTNEVTEALRQYYNVHEVTAYHVEDENNIICVWISYKEHDEKHLSDILVAIDNAARQLYPSSPKVSLCIGIDKETECLYIAKRENGSVSRLSENICKMSDIDLQKLEISCDDLGVDYAW